MWGGFFFFQAEDGIRDDLVTGVQTCALPISIPVYDAATTWADPVTRVQDAPMLDIMAIDNLPSLLPRESSLDFAAQLLPTLTALDNLDEIGRASCRERV